VRVRFCACWRLAESIALEVVENLLSRSRYGIRFLFSGYWSWYVGSCIYNIL
jgi:hypothetical protein